MEIAATVLLFGGFAWAMLNYGAASMHPAPSQTNMGGHIVAGLAAALIGLVWWVGIIIGWIW